MTALDELCVSPPTPGKLLRLCGQLAHGAGVYQHPYAAEVRALAGTALHPLALNAVAAALYTHRGPLVAHSPLVDTLVQHGYARPYIGEVAEPLPQGGWQGTTGEGWVRRLTERRLTTNAAVPGLAEARGAWAAAVSQAFDKGDVWGLGGLYSLVSPFPQRQLVENRKGWNPLQPRDPHGKWTKLPHPGTVKVIKQLGGSTGAKLVEDANGKQWVMKTGPHKAALINEAMADEAYRRLGVKVPNGGLVTDPKTGEVTKFTEYLDGQTLGQWEKTVSTYEKEAMYKKIQEDFHVDALLSNWDVIGADKDNILIHNGEPYRIDNGGALAYRAQGKPKTAAEFGTTVTELKTMLDPATNPTAAEVFKGVDLAALSDKLADDKTQQVVDALMPVFESNKDLKVQMGSRLVDLKNKLDTEVGLKAAKAQATVASSPLKAAGTTYTDIHGNYWQAGEKTAQGILKSLNPGELIPMDMVNVGTGGPFKSKFLLDQMEKAGHIHLSNGQWVMGPKPVAATAATPAIALSQAAIDFMHGQQWGTFDTATLKGEGLSHQDLELLKMMGHMKETSFGNYQIVSLPPKPVATPQPASGGLFHGVQIKDIPGWAALDGNQSASFGAVLYRKNAQTGEYEVLLRKPANNFGGYHWTFPKGQHSEATPLETAHKEVAEETGYTFTPTGHLQPVFSSGPMGSSTGFFIGEAAGKRDNAKLDGETSHVKWTPVSYAAELIGRTTNPEGKARDLSVLEEFKKVMGVSATPPKVSTSTHTTAAHLHAGQGLADYLTKKDVNGVLGKAFIDKIAPANPNGIQGGTIAVHAGKGFADKLELLKKVLPAGTVVKGFKASVEDVKAGKFQVAKGSHGIAHGSDGPSTGGTTAKPVSPPTVALPVKAKLPKNPDVAAAVKIVEELKAKGQLTGHTLKLQTDQLSSVGTHELFQHYGIEDYTKHPVGSFDALAADLVSTTPGTKAKPKAHGAVDVTKDYPAGSVEAALKKLASGVPNYNTTDDIKQTVSAWVGGLPKEDKGKLKVFLGIPAGQAGTIDKTFDAVVASLPFTPKPSPGYVPPSPPPPAAPTPKPAGTAGSKAKPVPGPQPKGVFVTPKKSMSVDGVFGVAHADEGAKSSSKPVNTTPSSVFLGRAYHAVHDDHIPDFTPDLPAFQDNAKTHVPYTGHYVNKQDVKEWLTKLTPEEKSVIDNWKVSSTTIRQTLYDTLGTGKEVSEDMKNIASAIQKMAPQPGVYYRGIDTGYSKELLKLAEEAVASGKKAWMYDVAPHGMTTNPTIAAKKFAMGELVLRVASKSARPIHDIAGYDYEAEVVGVPGTRYKIKGIHKNVTMAWDANELGTSSGSQKVKYVIDMEEI